MTVNQQAKTQATTLGKKEHQKVSVSTPAPADVPCTSSKTFLSALACSPMSLVWRSEVTVRESWMGEVEPIGASGETLRLSLNLVETEHLALLGADLSAFSLRGRWSCPGDHICGVGYSMCPMQLGGRSCCSRSLCSVK